MNASSARLVHGRHVSRELDTPRVRFARDYLASFAPSRVLTVNASSARRVHGRCVSRERGTPRVSYARDHLACLLQSDCERGEFGQGARLLSRRSANG